MFDCARPVSVTNSVTFAGCSRSNTPRNSSASGDKAASRVLPGAGRPAVHPVPRHAFPLSTQSWTCASFSSSASNSISAGSHLPMRIPCFGCAM
jgi:hypothetical protein